MKNQITHIFWSGSSWERIIIISESNLEVEADRIVFRSNEIRWLEQGLAMFYNDVELIATIFREKKNSTPHVEYKETYLYMIEPLL